MLTVLKKYTAGKRHVLQLMDDMENSGTCDATLYLAPDNYVSPFVINGLPSTQHTELAQIIEQAVPQDTGIVVFWCGKRVYIIAPPFPVHQNNYFSGASTGLLTDLLLSDFTVGIILLRLGHYAVGVYRGEELLASKSGSRYVKNRHRAGGSSQRRYMRSRDRTVRELFDEVCEVTRDVFEQYQGHIEYLLMGGEKHTLRSFVERCPLVDRMAPITLARTLEVGRPGMDALENMAYEAWKSRIVILEREENVPVNM